MVGSSISSRNTRLGGLLSGPLGSETFQFGFTFTSAAGHDDLGVLAQRTGGALCRRDRQIWKGNLMHENVQAAPLSAGTATRLAEGGRARHRGLPLGLVLLAQLLVVIDVSIVTLALPVIQRALHFSPVGLQWVLSGYALVFGGFLLLGGRLADLLGRRRTLIIGAAVFTAASLACGLSASAGALVAARAAEGLGAALMAPAALSLILAMFPEGPERNKALGAFGAVSGASGAIGVLAGGMLTTWLSWPSIFFVNLPVGALILAGARPLLPESRADLGHRRLDVAGAVTVTGGLSLLVYAVVTASSHGWSSAATIGLLTGSSALIAAFVLIEARSAAPLVPLSFFRNRTVAAANLAGLLLGGLMFPMFVFLSLYMQQVAWPAGRGSRRSWGSPGQWPRGGPTGRRPRPPRPWRRPGRDGSGPPGTRTKPCCPSTCCTSRSSWRPPGSSSAGPRRSPPSTRCWSSCPSPRPSACTRHWSGGSASPGSYPA